MRAVELIKELQKLDPDTIVGISSGGYAVPISGFYNRDILTKTIFSGGVDNDRYEKGICIYGDIDNVQYEE